MALLVEVELPYLEVAERRADRRLGVRNLG
jgi:hypothetical protein